MFRRIRSRRTARTHRLPQEKPLPAPAPTVGAPLPQEGLTAETYPPEDLRLPPDEKLAGRMMRYEAPLEIGGAVRVCLYCGADRDWLLLNAGDHVWMRCRGGHEWYEPSLDAKWFDRFCGPAHAVHGTREDALRSLGFDGTFAGTVL